MIFNVLLSIVRLSRPLNLLIAALTVYIMAYLSEISLTELIVLFTALTAMFTGAAGNIINDIYDLEIDSVNRPDRILPSKKISIQTAVFVYFIFIFISIGISIFTLNVYSRIIVLFTHLLLWIYSAYLKKTPLLGNITVAMILGLTFIFAGTAFDSVQTAIVPFLLAFFFSLTRELVKDIEDMDGDRIHHAKTLAIVLGAEKAKNFAMIIFSVSLLGLFVPYFTDIYGNIYVILISLTVFIPGIVVLNQLKNAVSKNDFGKVANLLKLLILPSLLSLILDFGLR